MANQAGVSLRTIQNWESGEKEPRGEKVRALSALGCVSMHYFYEPSFAEPVTPYGTEQSEIADRLHDFVRRWVQACNGDESRLHWLLVELENRFPIPDEATGPPPATPKEYRRPPLSKPTPPSN